MQRILWTSLLLGSLGLPAAWAFSFSEHAADERAEERAQVRAQERLADDLQATPCKSEVKKRKIALLVAEERISSGKQKTYKDFGPLFEAINVKLRALGLRTFTQAEIQAQIARAEAVAYVNGDTDGAIQAASRLAAGYLLRARIQSRSQVNPVIGVNEVFINLELNLTDSQGRLISRTAARGDSYAGADTLTVALDLVEQQADVLVGQLYHDLCSTR